MKLNNKRVIPNLKRVTIGLVNLVKPSDITKEDYIKHINKKHRCCIINSNGEFIKDAVISSHCIQYLTIPDENDQLGSTLVIANVTLDEYPIIIGVLYDQDIVLDENTHSIVKDTEAGFSSLKIGSGMMKNYIHRGNDESGLYELIIKGNNDSKHSIFVDGDSFLYAENLIRYSSKGTINFIIKDSENEAICDFSMNAEGLIYSDELENPNLVSLTNDSIELSHKENVITIGNDYIRIDKGGDIIEIVDDKISLKKGSTSIEIDGSVIDLVGGGGAGVKIEAAGLTIKSSTTNIKDLFSSVDEIITAIISGVSPNPYNNPAGITEAGVKLALLKTKIPLVLK